METLQPIAVISDNLYYPSYPLLNEKLSLLTELQCKFIPSITMKPLQQSKCVLNAIISLNTIILQNSIRLCIDRLK